MATEAQRAETWRVEVPCADWDFVAKLIALSSTPGGLFVPTRRPRQVGERVELTLVLPDGTSKKLMGTVHGVLSPEKALMEHGAPGVGVQLDAPDAIDLMILDELARKSPAPAAPLPSPAPVKPRATQPRICEVVGIDFGTTYSSISVAVDGRVQLIADPLGRTLQPSIVGISRSGAPVAGWAGREVVLEDPRRAVTAPKRLLGRSFEDPTIAGLLQTAPYRTTKGVGGQVVVDLENRTFPLVEIASKILALLREVAERKLSTAVTRAVITVPVAFDPRQVDALKRAARMAGLEVLEVLPEPVAAALSFGLPENRTDRIAAYDFGGGTFDFTVVDFEAGKHRVLGSGGDEWLGGDDFDLAIASNAADAFWRSTKVELRERLVEWHRLLHASERAKRELSDVEQTLVKLDLTLTGHGRPLEHPLNRAKLEQLCAPLLERTLDVCREVMAKARVTPRDIADVVVTGGVSRIPFIRAGVSRFFGRPINQLVNPEEAVALGAGYWAAQRVGYDVRGVSGDPL